jgi:hypothetical protein
MGKRQGKGEKGAPTGILSDGARSSSRRAALREKGKKEWGIGFSVRSRGGDNLFLLHARAAVDHDDRLTVARPL